MLSSSIHDDRVSDQHFGHEVIQKVRSGLSHFTKKHGVNVAEVKEWVLIKDQNRLRRGVPSVAFQVAYKEMEEWAINHGEGEEGPEAGAAVPHDEDPIEYVGDDEPVDVPTATQVVARLDDVRTAGLVPKAAATATMHTTQENITAFFNRAGNRAGHASSSTGDMLMGALSDIHGKLNSIIDSNRLEIDVPTVTIAQNAQEWQHPPTQKLRETYPFDDDDVCKFSLAEFERYIKTNTNMKKAETRKYCMTAITRLFRLLEIPDGTESVSALCAIYQQGVLHALSELPILDVRYTWARNMYGALAHFATHCTHLCNRRMHNKAATIVQCLLDEVVKCLNKRSLAQRSESKLISQLLPHRLLRMMLHGLSKLIRF